MALMRPSEPASSPSISASTPPKSSSHASPFSPPSQSRRDRLRRPRQAEYRSCAKSARSQRGGRQRVCRTPTLPSRKARLKRRNDDPGASCSSGTAATTAVSSFVPFCLATKRRWSARRSPTTARSTGPPLRSGSSGSGILLFLFPFLLLVVPSSAAAAADLCICLLSAPPYMGLRGRKGNMALMRPPERSHCMSDEWRLRRPLSLSPVTPTSRRRDVEMLRCRHFTVRNCATREINTLASTPVRVVESTLLASSISFLKSSSINTTLVVVLCIHVN